MNVRSVRHVKEAGKVILMADQEGLEIWRLVILDCEQINPIGEGIPSAPGHGHELLYVDGDQVDKKGGLPKSAYIEDRQSVQFVCAPLVVLDIKSTQSSSMHTSSDGLSAWGWSHIFPSAAEGARGRMKYMKLVYQPLDNRSTSM